MPSFNTTLFGNLNVTVEVDPVTLCIDTVTTEDGTELDLTGVRFLSKTMIAGVKNMVTLEMLLEDQIEDCMQQYHAEVAEYQQARGRDKGEE